jgi:hypothetical protein
MTNIARAARGRSSWAAETTEGSTVATPVFQQMHLTEDSINQRYIKEGSANLASHGDQTHVSSDGYTVEGNLGAEMVYGEIDWLLENALRSTWTSNIITNAQDRNPVTWERMLKTGSTNNHFRFNGVHANTLTIDAEFQKKVTWQAGMMGMTATSGAAVVGATYPDPSSVEVINVCAGFANLAIGNLGATATVKKITYNWSNNHEFTPHLGTCASGELSFGEPQLQVTVEAYFDNMALWDAVKNHTEVSLTSELGNSAGSKYRINVPKLYINADMPTLTTGDSMINFTMDAIRDEAGIGATWKITRGI